MTVNHPKSGEAWAWAGAVAILSTLLVVRFRAAVFAPHGPDLDIYLAAARAITEGRNPWDTGGYVYPPLVALALVPVVSSARSVEIWMGASLLAAVIAIAAFSATIYPDLPKRWMRPVLFAVFSITLLYSWPATWELFFGQTNLFVFALVALAGLATARHRPGAAGVALALASLVKTWPIGAALWFARRGASRRWTSVAALLTTLAVAGVATFVAWGPDGVDAWTDTTVDYATQDVVSYSIWGFPRNVFGTYGELTPIIVSPLLGTLTGALLFAGVLSLLLIALLRPGTPVVSLWNVFACVLLLLPVSHMNYRILYLPILWFWVAAYVSARRRSAIDHVFVATLAVWWILGFRVIWPAGEPGMVGFLVVMSASLAVVATSVIRATRIPRGASGLPRDADADPDPDPDPSV